MSEEDEKVVTLDKSKKKSPRTLIDDIADQVTETLLEEAEAKEGEVIKLTDRKKVDKFYYGLIDVINVHFNDMRVHGSPRHWLEKVCDIAIAEHGPEPVPDKGWNDFTQYTLVHLLRLYETVMYYVPPYIYTTNRLELQESISEFGPRGDHVERVLYYGVNLARNTSLFFYFYELKDGEEITDKKVTVDTYNRNIYNKGKIVSIENKKFDEDFIVDCPAPILTNILKGFTLIASRYAGGYRMRDYAKHNRKEMTCEFLLDDKHICQLTMVIDNEQYEIITNVELPNEK